MSATFNSQQCYLQDTLYTIEDFARLNHSTCGTPMDVDGNELIWCKGNAQTKPYFRRHRGHYEPMTEWHFNWQNHFTDSKERTLQMGRGSHRRTRRADVDLNNDTVIEFQHSPISKDEVSARRSDYQAIGKDIVWVIDANQGVQVFHLHNPRVFLEFQQLWKYKVFRDDNEQNNNFIYLNIGDLVYRVSPNVVRSHMIDVEAPISKTDFITFLKTGTGPFQNAPTSPPQSRLFVKQQGAGNGKTFGIVQLIRDTNFAHYDTFVYLTKQHSAVHVIRAEIADQRENGLLPNVEFGETQSHGKKTVLPFRMKANTPDTDTPPKWRSIVVGTFDSFAHSLARHQDIKGIDKFQEMVNSIVKDEQLSSCTESGLLKYAGQIQLNKRLLLIGDEMQDLPTNYAQAVVRIMHNWYVDFYAVGDRLQSISIKHNAFTYFADKANGMSDQSDQSDTEGLPDIDIQCPDPHNICRRFIHPPLVNFVNTVVDFDTFALPKIEPYRTVEETDYHGTTLKVFGGKTVYADSTDKEFINHEVNEIMKHYIHEVETNRRRPNDFLIVTPFVQKNPLVEALHQAIRDYWVVQDTSHNSQYKHYSCFHKSQEGTSIDLSESEDCTRIVSIHSSKGDGRKVVFVIGMTESGLKRFSKDTGNLVYNSLLHVACTRMKETLYIRLEPNGDDIHQRIQNYDEQTGYNFDIEPTFCVKKSLDLTKDLLRINQEETFVKCLDAIIRHSEQHGVDIDHYGESDAPETTRSPKRIIDMKHHRYRYATMIVQSFLTIRHLQYKWKRQGKTQIDETTTMKLEFYAILKQIADADIEHCQDGKRYWTHLSDKNKNFIPFRKRSGGEYEQHYNSICDSITRVQQYLQKILKPGYTPSEGLPSKPVLGYMDCVVLFHLIEVDQNRKYAELPVSDLYDLFDNEHKASANEKRLYLKNHYQDTALIHKLWEQFFDTNGPMNISYSNPIVWENVTSDLRIKQGLSFEAYNGKTVIHVLIKPQFTSLNFNETLYHSIFTSHLLHRRRHKDVRHCVMTLSLETPYYIDWKDTATGDNLVVQQSSALTDILRELMKEYYHQECCIVHRWYNYTRRQIPSEQRKAVSAANYILCEYCEKDKKHQNARFVRSTLDAIKTRVSDFRPKSERWNYLLSYDNKDTFLSLLQERADEAINEFFEVESDSDEDDEL